MNKEIKDEENGTEYPNGGIWEEPEITVYKDSIYDVMYYNICKHAFDINDKTFKIPFTIQVMNEGGCNSTGLCFDCAKESISLLL